jgi:hypothetical protein
VASVPGRGGVDTVVFNWEAPADLAPHTCMIATLDAIPDPLPEPTGGLSDIVRNSNNITWKNLHVVTIPEITSEISNFSEAPAPTILQVSSNDIPLGTVFTLTPQPPIALQEFQPDSPVQMQLVSLADDETIFIRTAQAEDRFNLRVDLPAASDKTPFVNPFTLKIALPGSATSDTYTITITQYEFDAATGGIGEIVGGNTYEVSFEQ